MGKRITPIEEIERFAERLASAYPSIQTRLDYDLAFDDYMEQLTPAQDTILRENVWEHMTSANPNLSVVGKSQPKTKQKREYKYEKAGKVKGKVVYARQDSYQIKGKKRIVYRDKLGRFVHVRDYVLRGGRLVRK